LEAKNNYPLSDGDPTVVSIVDSLDRLNQKLDSIVSFTSQILKVNEMLLEKLKGKGQGGKNELSLPPDTLSLLSLPLSLRKTVMVLYRLDRATADDLARETGRLRAVESSSANQLVRMGYLKKIREGRDVYFYIDVSEEEKQ
jgi:hypothetical protein